MYSEAVVVRPNWVVVASEVPKCHDYWGRPCLLGQLPTTVQESLETEKLSKEALTREASEVKVLLEEESARLETERKRADDEGEARRRLESLLVTEKKKEEDMVRYFCCTLTRGRDKASPAQSNKNCSSVFHVFHERRCSLENMRARISEGRAAAPMRDTVVVKSGQISPAAISTRRCR